MVSSSLLVAVVVILFSIWWYLNTRIPRQFPPGPPRYPIFGSLWYMLQKGKGLEKRTLMHGIFSNVKKYGKLMGFYIGYRPFVVVADYEMMKDLLKRDEVSGRPDQRPLNEFYLGHATMDKENFGRAPGVMFGQGRYWREQRRFLFKHLRDFGFGKTELR